jgi:TPR repeat protein
MCNLGACYENGEGVERNLEEATKWYRQSAANGVGMAIVALKRLEKKADVCR